MAAAAAASSSEAQAAQGGEWPDGDPRLVARTGRGKQRYEATGARLVAGCVGL